MGSVILDDSTYNLWYGGLDGCTWRIGYATSNVDPVSVRTSGALIETFNLSQNFPNPFNPSTTIKYGLKERANVDLKIFDINGRELSILIDKEQSAGNYEIVFDASSLPSGIYFYRLQVYPANGGAGDFVQARKMILLK